MQRLENFQSDLNQISPMDPKAYNEIIKTVNLVGCRLTSLNSQLKFNNSEQQLTAKFEMESSLAERKDDDVYPVMSRCSLSIFAATPEDFTAEIKAEYLTEFVSKHEFTKEFFDIFKESSVKIIVWPYFREMVHGLMMKMGLPGLVLPIILNLLFPEKAKD